MLAIIIFYHFTSGWFAKINLVNPQLKDLSFEQSKQGPQCTEGLKPPPIDNPLTWPCPFYLFSEPPAFGKTFSTILPQ